jgi:hypothetical protein
MMIHLINHASHFVGAGFANCSIAEQSIELHLGNAVALARALSHR